MPKLCYSEMGKCFLFQTDDFLPGWLQGWEQAARRGRELLGATGCYWVVLGGTGCCWVLLGAVAAWGAGAGRRTARCSRCRAQRGGG